MMQKEKIIVTDENRQDITSVYCHRLLDDMDFDTLYSFAYDMLRDSKNEYNNEQLTTEISEYYPDILEN
jgi:hypothetical protein